jgi:endonuclease/exonuclease/phosphatase (EEP) superfamily protein YafD
VKSAIVALAGVFVLFASSNGCATAPRVAEVPDGPHVRVMTYNVNWGFDRPELGLKAIIDGDADVVCLQESNESWEAYLRPALAGRYPNMTFHHEPAAGGMAVLSRSPFEEVAYALPPGDGGAGGGWFHGWAVRARTPVGPVQFLNVHLRPPLSDRGGASLGALYTTRAVRRGEIESHCANLTPGVPTVVVGDFNESDGGAAVRFVESLSFTDALPQFDRRGDTWEWPVGPITLRGRYDHVLYSKELRCFEARVVREGASDHFPVVAVLGAAID